MRVVPSVHSDDYYGEKEDNSGDGDRQTTRATPTIKPSTETDQPQARGHFTVRRLERKYGAVTVEEAYVQA